MAVGSRPMHDLTKFFLSCTLPMLVLLPRTLLHLPLLQALVLRATAAAAAAAASALAAAAPAVSISECVSSGFTSGG